MDDQSTNHSPKVSFEFFVTYSKKFVESIKKGNLVEETKHDGMIEACGVFPIYASEYHNFLQQMELESKLGNQKETCHDVEEHSLHGILEYARSSLKQGKCGNSEGSIIPNWFTSKSSIIEFKRLHLSVQLAADLDNLRGFIFCFVIPHFSPEERDLCYSSCKCCLYHGGCCRFYLEGPTRWHYSMIKLNSDNIFLWYDPLYCKLILDKLRQKGNGQHEELKFEFRFGDCVIRKWGFDIGDCLIKECGVRPIYVSEYTNLLQQKELKLSAQKKRHRSSDDDCEQLPSTKM